jgi:hypothetical protein
MIKQLLALFKKQKPQHSTYAAWLRYCVENPSALECRIYDI